MNPGAGPQPAAPEHARTPPRALPETERLRFRPFHLDEAEELCRSFSDDASRRFYPQMADAVRARSWILWNLACQARHGLSLWAIERKDTGALVGDAGLTFQEVDGQLELEVGYHVVPRERRRGYATEAARACVDFGFASTSTLRIGSVVHPANVASHGVARKLYAHCRAFQRRGTELAFYSSTRGAWLERRPASDVGGGA